jgi:dolichyl-phosphate-mannose--protein O-mannosyl transferase
MGSNKKTPANDKNKDSRQLLGKFFWWGLAAILAFSLCTKLPRLGYPDKFYYDELYHGYTATHYLHGNADAYDPWAKMPEGSPAGSAYEWTHPPLAKLIMSGFMLVAGERPWGWRIGSVLFSTGAIALTAWVAWELFASGAIALLAAFFLSIEGLAFAQGRIAMNDSYFIFFALASCGAYLRWRKRGGGPVLYVAGAALGLALSCKWTALYLFGILGLDLARSYFLGRGPRLRQPVWQLALVFGALPLLIYFLSYSQLYWLKGFHWEGNAGFWTIQQQMWWYHSGLKATHAYQSQPWQWILNLRPVWLDVAYPNDATIAYMYNIGNSVILIGGLFVSLALLFRPEREKVPHEHVWARWFVLLAYFLFWVPWSFSPRIMLFYHYLPAVPFLCILLARALTVRGRRWVVPVTVAASAWFVLFYPHLTGIAVSRSFSESVYQALPGWK